jgi:ABC transport system ATP-binding/permease protein
VILASHDRDFLDRIATSVLVAEGNARWTEYAGGYSDMVAQRGQGLSASPVQKPGREKADPKAQTAPPPRAKRKLSFKEKHALETLPGRMEALRSEAARHKAVLADSDLYRRDRAKFTAATEALANATTALSEAEDEWLTLEILREEIEG